MQKIHAHLLLLLCPPTSPLTQSQISLAVIVCRSISLLFSPLHPPLAIFFLHSQLFFTSPGWCTMETAGDWTGGEEGGGIRSFIIRGCGWGGTNVWQRGRRFNAQPAELGVLRGNCFLRLSATGRTNLASSWDYPNCILIPWDFALACYIHPILNKWKHFVRYLSRGVRRDRVVCFPCSCLEITSLHSGLMLPFAKPLYFQLFSKLGRKVRFGSLGCI